jgi:hypothetical protein
MLHLIYWVKILMKNSFPEIILEYIIAAALALIVLFIIILIAKAYDKPKDTE